MHEALISRGDVQGSSKDKQALIFDRRNMVLVHSNCHKPGTAGDEIWEKCLRHLVQHEGLDAIREYLLMMKDNFKIIGSQAYQRFLQYYPEKSLNDHPAFGSWKNVKIDGVEYQEEIRKEWD